MRVVEGRTTGALLPADDPGWASYAETILVIHGSTPVEVPLSRPIGARERAAFAAAGLPGPFGVLTADNPFGRPMSAEGNAARRTQLAAELDSAGVAAVRVDGYSPDRQHHEVGVALQWPQHEVVALAKRWEQSAIYWFDGESMWVIGALTVAPPWKLEPL